jgi:hypothetical protein
MPEKKRTFEADTQALPGLKTQPRARKKADETIPADGNLTDAGEQVQPMVVGRSFSKESVLRLIDWMKSE